MLTDKESHSCDPGSPGWQWHEWWGYLQVSRSLPQDDWEGIFKAVWRAGSGQVIDPYIQEHPQNVTLGTNLLCVWTRACIGPAGSSRLCQHHHLNTVPGGEQVVVWEPDEYWDRQQLVAGSSYWKQCYQCEKCHYLHCTDEETEAQLS